MPYPLPRLVWQLGSQVGSVAADTKGWEVEAGSTAKFD